MEDREIPQAHQIEERASSLLCSDGPCQQDHRFQGLN